MNLSILIPARNEPFLKRTVEDVLENATRDIEILVGLDGWDFTVWDDPRVRWIHEEESIGMRPMLNKLAGLAEGKHLMKLDAHCLVAKGFDEQLIKDHQPTWVQIPRRERLDADKWEVIKDGRPPVDYEFIVFENLLRGFIWGTTWEERTQERSDPIDDTMHFQGSCWFMTKEWFTKNNLFSLAYGTFAQESEEILFNTLLNGGSVKTNKNTYYAHLHKNHEQRKWFEFESEELRAGIAYSHNLWVKENKELFISWVEKFMPIPGWPSHWKKMLWN